MSLGKLDFMTNRTEVRQFGHRLNIFTACLSVPIFVAILKLLEYFSEFQWIPISLSQFTFPTLACLVAIVAHQVIITKYGLTFGFFMVTRAGGYTKSLQLQSTAPITLPCSVHHFSRTSS